MTVRMSEEGTIRLEGACPIDEAETLQRLLLENAYAAVDWHACTHLHTALIQLLLAAKRPIVGPAGEEFLEQWISPHVQALTP